ncbi:MAG: alanine racemase [Anaerolineae bacterium]|nr:alanine racemase [Phycisphaerae bacterium]
MRPSQFPEAQIDLNRVRANAQRIIHQTKVPVIAVIKAQAYGLGARDVTMALSELVDSFYCFSLGEAIDAGTRDTGKSTIAIALDESISAEDYRSHNVRPAVWNVRQAERLRSARGVLVVDTGQQRFACPRERIDDVIRAGEIDEAFTHATRVEHARMLADWCAAKNLRLHAAASSLLDVPEARLDAVRPGLALYRDAVHVTTRLLEARDTIGPTGYGGFVSSTGRHGVIAGGFTAGVRPGPCRINGQARRVVECGMQTSFVEIGKNDHAGDEVVLLGDDLPIEEIASASNVTPHEALWRLASSNRRSAT